MERRSSLVGLVRPAFIAVGPPPYAFSATCFDRMSTTPCLAYWHRVLKEKIGLACDLHSSTLKQAAQALPVFFFTFF